MAHTPASNPASPARHPRFPRGSTMGGIIAGVAMVLVAVGYGVFRFVAKPDPADPAAGASAADWYTVDRRSFDQTVLATGELRARDQQEVKSLVEAGTTIVSIVEEGVTVEQGQLLVKLSDDAIKEKIETDELAFEKAVETEVTTRQELAIEESEAASLIELATVEVEMARLDLEKWRNGDVILKRAELRLALEEARRNLARAEDNIKLSKQLYAEEFISKQELDDDDLKLVKAQEALKTAQQEIEVYDKYTHPKEMRQKQSGLTQAQAKLDRTSGKAKNNVEKARAAVESAKKTLALRDERLKNLKEQLKATEVLAPAAGLVVYSTSVGNRRYSREPIAQGGAVKFNEVIIYLPDTRHMQATLQVHEAMVRYAEPGQQVQLIVDAAPGKTFIGTVGNIGAMADKGNWMNGNLRQYPVRVDLDTMPDSSLKPGMRCSGTVLVGSVRGALAAPVQAVFAEDKQRYCYVQAVGGVRRTRVELGRASETYVEIKEGLKEGDHILQRTPRPGEVVNPPTPEEIAQAQKEQREEAERLLRDRPAPASPGATQPAPATRPLHPNPAPPAAKTDLAKPEKAPRGDRPPRDADPSRPPRPPR